MGRLRGVRTSQRLLLKVGKVRALLCWGLQCRTLSMCMHWSCRFVYEHVRRTTCLHELSPNVHLEPCDSLPIVVGIHTMRSVGHFKCFCMTLFFSLACFSIWVVC